MARAAHEAPAMVSFRPLGWALVTLWSLGPVAACGSGASMPAGGPVGSCGQGDVYCATCGGGGVCAQNCPNVACPVAADSGGSDAANAEGGVCGAGQVSCIDCSGGAFCVAGGCPATTCPVRDAGTAAQPPVDGSGDVRSDSNMTRFDAGGASICPGASPPPAGYPLCRSVADCVSATDCAPQPVGGCGACRQAYRQCETDANCFPTGTMVCESYVVTGFCMCGQGTQCVPKCPATPCAADSQCSASGHCVPATCGPAYACSTDRTCKPSDPAADAHGCIPRLCTDGFACGADQECNTTATGADAHGCAPKPCSNGYACPTWWHCVAGPSADEHGCTAIPCSNSAPCGVNEGCDPTQPGRGCGLRKCTSDRDCDCGACVEGYCRSSLWVCSSKSA